MVIKDGDLLRSEVQTLVNPVNCVGSMGRGLALSLRKKYPDMYQDYLFRCMRRDVRLGHPYAYYDETGRVILNFPTKGHFRELSSLNHIEAGLIRFVKQYEALGIRSIAFPALGCGCGKLAWTDVFPVMQKHLATLPLYIEVYMPHIDA